MAVISLSAPTPNAYEKTLNAARDATVAKPGVFRITADVAPGSNLVIPIAKSGGSAVSGTDYVALPSTITLPAGQTQVNFNLTPIVKGPTVFTGIRPLTLSISGAGGYSVGTASATVTIRVIEHTIYGGVVGATPTSIERFTNGDGKHAVTDPASGPIGYYRVGYIGKRAVIVDPSGMAMGSIRGHFFVGPSVTSVYLNAAGARFGTSATQGAVNWPVCDFILKAETRSGFNFVGGGHTLQANPLPRQNAGLFAGAQNGLVPAQQPGSLDRKSAVIYLSHQRECMRFYGVKNIVGRPPVGGETINTQQTAIPGYPTASKKNSLGACYLPDVFDDPAQVAGAQGRYNSSCSGTANGSLIRHTQDWGTWDTSANGPEYAPLTSPWWLMVHFDERDFCNGMGEYHRHVGYAMLTCQPFIQQYNVVGTIVSPSGVDQTVWSKIKAREFLRARYGNNISALNTAWGTGGFYTTFDSAGGYGVGTGLYDEDGQQPWFGTDGVRLLDANQQVRLDLDDLEDTYWEQLWSVLAKGLNEGHTNRLKATHAGTLDSKWACSRVAAKYLDVLGGEKDIAGDHPRSAGFGYDAPDNAVTLTLSATTGTAVTVTGNTWGLNASGGSIRGRCIVQNVANGGFGIIQQFINTTQLRMEVLRPFTTTTLAGGSYRYGIHSESIWMKYRRPRWSWVAYLSGPDSYFGTWTGQGSFLGNPSYGPTSYYIPGGGGAATQALRAAIYRQNSMERLNFTAADGYKFDVGQEMWEANDRVAENTQFGIVSADCKMYDGVDRPQNGDFYTPALAVADEIDYTILIESSNQLPPPPVFQFFGTDAARVTLAETAVVESITGVFPVAVAGTDRVAVALLHLTDHDVAATVETGLAIGWAEAIFSSNTARLVTEALPVGWSETARSGLHEPWPVADTSANVNGLLAWTRLQGTAWGVSGQRATITAAGSTRQVARADTSLGSADQEVSVSLVGFVRNIAPRISAGVLLRVQAGAGDLSCYEARAVLSATGNALELRRMNAGGTETLLATVAVTVQPGDVLRASITSQTLRVWLNDALQIGPLDDGAGLATGNFGGIAGERQDAAAVVQVDDWVARVAPAVPIDHPVSDPLRVILTVAATDLDRSEGGALPIGWGETQAVVASTRTIVEVETLRVQFTETPQDALAVRTATESLAVALSEAVTIDVPAIGVTDPLVVRLTEAASLPTQTARPVDSLPVRVSEVAVKEFTDAEMEDFETWRVGWAETQVQAAVTADVLLTPTEALHIGWSESGRVAFTPQTSDSVRVRLTEVGVQVVPPKPIVRLVQLQNERVMVAGFATEGLQTAGVVEGSERETFVSLINEGTEIGGA